MFAVIAHVLTLLIITIAALLNPENVDLNSEMSSLH